jgi:hypothetical protein
VSTLPRWSEEGATAEELRLIEASRRERPDPEARLRTLLALGVGGPSGGSPPAGGEPSAGRGWRVLTTSKKVILAVCGGGAIAGAAWFALAHRSPVPAAASNPSIPIVPPVAPPPTLGPVAPAIIEAPSKGPATSAATGDREPPPRATLRRSIRRVPSAGPARSSEAVDPAKPLVAESTLAAEVAALERAHEALAGHDAGSAMRALDRYEANFPAGRLASEETVLRVQALLAEGDRHAAGALAERFFSVHPESSYARRVRDLLHDAEERQKKK